jgi:hypothetical protein
MVVVELFNAPNQRHVRLLAHDDLAECIGGDQHRIGACVDGARIDAGTGHERTVKALDDWTRLHWRRFGWLEPE